MDKLLSKMSEINIKEAVEHVFDDSNIDFDLMKIFLRYAEKTQMNVQELINHKDTSTYQTALHILMRSNLTDDITNDLNFLLEKGGDIMIQGKPLQNNEFELPVHIATNLQNIYDEDPHSKAGF